LTLRRTAPICSAGIAVAIDDFGTGSTSVAQLTSMPVNGVILDAALTDGIAPDTSQARRVGALIAMANALGITVTAKRIETAAQLQCLVALGCHHAQGNALSSPLAPDELAHVLRGAETTAI
jgi:EAL domain-containing protein (putative c-di-GMP-specific phosphodiesterase class I)